MVDEPALALALGATFALFPWDDDLSAWRELARLAENGEARVHVLWGSKDNVTPPAGASLLRGLMGAGADVEVWEGYGHSLPYEHAEETARWALGKCGRAA